MQPRYANAFMIFNIWSFTSIISNWDSAVLLNKMLNLHCAYRAYSNIFCKGESYENLKTAS